MTDISRCDAADLPERDSIHLEGTRKQALDVGRNRLLVTGAVLVLVYLVIAGRLVDVTVLETPSDARIAAREPLRDATGPQATPVAGRANIVDRNGVVLAASLPTVSLYANPREVLDPKDTAAKIAAVLPDLDRERLLARLQAGGAFAWLRRNLTPKQQYDIHRLGLPGIHFQRANRRVYPHGATAGHVLGLTDIDGHGIAGIERTFDKRLSDAPEPLALSIDLRVQSILQEELGRAMQEFSAKGAAGVVMDVGSGEVMGMMSLPLFDPNAPDAADPDAVFNRATKGVYEMGSTFKVFTTAMALDTATVSPNGGYDASKPIKISRFQIDDYHGKHRWLSVTEILIYSSNIGAAKMALDVGGKTQQAYLEKLGMLRTLPLELPEVGTPLKPAVWRDINVMTIGYGHGIAVTPLHMAAGMSAVVNGGIYHAPTVIKRDPQARIVGTQVFTPETSAAMRRMLREVVTSGTGGNAALAEYRIGGKTGTADKLSKSGGYQTNARISSFIAAFPIEAPRYVVLVMLDEPKGNRQTQGYATGGWVAAPAAGRVMLRVGALDGIPPEVGDKPQPKKNPLLVNAAHQPAPPREPNRAPQ